MSDHEQLPLYALGSLPDDERVAFEAHLRTCAQCRGELASYEPALSHMAAAVAEPPPPSLRSAVLARVGEIPQEQPVAQAPVPLRQRAPRPTRWLALAAAVLAVALVAVSATGLMLWQRTGDLEAQMAQARQMSQLERVLAAEDAQLIDVDSDMPGSMRVAMAPSLDAAVVLGDGMADPPDDTVYQLWTLEDGQTRNAGLIPQRSGVLALLDDMSGVDGVAVSMEPPPGSAAPTGPIVAQAQFNG